MVNLMNQKLVGRLMWFERDGRRSFVLNLKTPAGRMEVDAFCPNSDGNIPASQFTEILDDLVDTRRRVQFEINGDDLVGIVGILPLKPDSANVMDGAFSAPRPRRTYPCWSCGEPLTRKNARDGIVGVIIRTSKFGTRRVAVHLGCEDDAMNEGIAIF
jgi:hypothetical protein